MTNIPRGTDNDIRITITGTDGNPVDINSCDDIRVDVYHNTNAILQTFKLSESSIDVEDAVNGIIICKLDRESITDVSISKLYCEITVDITDGTFVDGYKRHKTTGVLLGVLVNSVS